MKKLLIIVLSLILAVGFTACSTEEPSFESIDYVQSALNFRRKVYTVETVSETCGLTDTSTLRIGKTDGGYTAEYRYETQRYSSAVAGESGLTGGEIVTESGTQYYNGSTLGAVSGGSVDWISAEIPALTSDKFNISESDFVSYSVTLSGADTDSAEAETSVETSEEASVETSEEASAVEDTSVDSSEAEVSVGGIIVFEGVLKDDVAQQLFGFGLTDAVLVIKVDVNGKKVLKMSLNYVFSGEDVALTVTYGYDLQTVYMP